MKGASKRTMRLTEKIKAGQTATLVDISCAVLAGGESKRLGADKSRLHIYGKALLERALEIVMPSFDDIMICVHETKEGFEEYVSNILDNTELACETRRTGKVRIITDSLTGRGPALGVCAALESSKNDWVFAVACDMPLLSASLMTRLSLMREGYDCVVPSFCGKAQPLFAFYKKSCLEPLAQRIRNAGSQKDRSLIGFLNNTKDLKVRYVEKAELNEADQGLYSFMDVDTPGDLEEAESILKQRGDKRE